MFPPTTEVSFRPSPPPEPDLEICRLQQIKSRKDGVEEEEEEERKHLGDRFVVFIFIFCSCHSVGSETRTFEFGRTFGRNQRKAPVYNSLAAWAYQQGGEHCKTCKSRTKLLSIFCKGRLLHSAE
ncbi:hypothetical protein SLE2022_241980 [Rubroshorea leprosula]